MCVRRALSATIGVTALAWGAGVGCTLLVPFDTDDAGVEVDATGPGPMVEAGPGPDETGTGDDGPTGDEGPVDVPDGHAAKCAAYTPNDAAAPCPEPGTFCACDMLANYQGSADDLVTCKAAGANLTAITCPNGCGAMPQGLPDECDPCAKRPDGNYCGKDVGYDGGSAVITCKSGHQLGVGSKCTTSCLGKGPDASCN